MAVDGNSLVHRSFHAQAATGTHSPTGRPSWAVRGLLAQLVAAVERLGPDVVVVGFDDPDRSWRRERWPQYKASRVTKLQTLVDQLAFAVDVLRELGLAVVVPDGLEADDVLASAAAAAARLDATAVLVTSDRDAFALIDDRTQVLRIIDGGVAASPLLTPERLVTLLGVAPNQYRDYAALRGDCSDNLPGVPGIGPKTATRLLCRFGSAQAVFDDVASGGAAVLAAVGAGIHRRLAQPTARAAWIRNCEIMAMRVDVELDLRLPAGPGVLPLPAAVVRATYETHRLTSTLPTALRVLAGHHGPMVTDSPAADRSVNVSVNLGAKSWFRPRRFPALPTQSAGRQLSLFD